MAAAKVKCLYCGEIFDRNKEPNYKIKNRYAHQECYNKYSKDKSQEELDLEELEEYIKYITKLKYVNPRIRKQIKDYRQEYNYTYSGILKSLKYWCEIQGKTIEWQEYGIAIVGYIYNSACQYYYSLYLANLANKDKDLSKYIPKIKNIKIRSPKKEGKKVKFFDLGE